MSNSHLLDQICYCERCGISFLWSAEEQKQERSDEQPIEPEKRQTKRPTNTPPSHCPGCRLLLPPAGRERGVVKWYNHRKRYGFLVRRDQPEIFAHGSEIQGANSLRPGDLVEFRVGSSERGLAAQEISIIGHTEPPVQD